MDEARHATHAAVVALLNDVQHTRTDLIRCQWFDASRRPAKRILNSDLRDRIRAVNASDSPMLTSTVNSPDTPVLLLPIQGANLDEVKERGYTIVFNEGKILT